MVKAPFYDKNGLKKGAWSPEEDGKLKAHIERYGPWNWRELPKYAGLSRCGKSCRLRWMNYLRPHVKHGNFTKEEEYTIFTLHAEVGNKWSTIAAKLPGRTDNEVKNFWHTRLKKHAKVDTVTRKTLKEQTCVAKKQSRESSKYNQTNKKEKVENVPNDVMSHAILESSPLSPRESAGDISSTSSEIVHFSGRTVMGNDLVVHEVSDDGSGDFWSEPFVADSAFVQNCISFDFWYDSIYDTSEDLLYQVIQELPRSCVDEVN